MTDVAHLTMPEVLDNLCEQLWGPPHPDADYPRHWTDLPAKLAEELAEDEDLRNRMAELLRGQRYESANADRNDVRAERVRLVDQLNAIRKNSAFTPPINAAVLARLRFIDFALDHFGTLNRAVLMDFFGVSMSQASHDLRAYIALAPANIKYDGVLRAYRRGEAYQRKFP
jgi:hypothetical protein